VSRIWTSISLVTLLAFGTTGCGSLLFDGGDMSHLREAEMLSRQGRYDDAIRAYEQHLLRRLEVDDRPEWENPYFYKLLIGDIHLRENAVDRALDAYQEAHRHGIDTVMVADRLRSVGRWYEQRGDYKRAFELLTAHRELDPLLFDTILDRVARRMVEAEERMSRDSGASSAPSR
jgi:tetratricopeptide (TPR) repeat protein